MLMAVFRLVGLEVCIPIEALFPLSAELSGRRPAPVAARNEVRGHVAGQTQLGTVPANLVAPGFPRRKVGFSGHVA
jgi:hypothetical protein